MKRKLCLIGLISLCLQARPQTKTTSKYLTVGDQMPDVKITNIINSKMKTARITDFRGKLIILDIWETTCSSCVAAFPEMDSLQHLFPKGLQILLVNDKNKYDNQRRVNTVIGLTTEIMGRPFQLPIVLADTALSGLFQFNTIPHCIWIGPQGKIIGITGKPAVNADNIARVLRGEQVHLPLKTLKTL